MSTTPRVGLVVLRDELAAARSAAGRARQVLGDQDGSHASQDHCCRRWPDGLRVRVACTRAGRATRTRRAHQDHRRDATQVARMAYFSGWPMANIHSRLATLLPVKEFVFGGGVRRWRRSTSSPCSPTTSSRRSGPSPARTRTWSTAAAPRSGCRIAGGDPGAGFRRPLLGLSGRRPAHRQLCRPRQDVRHHSPASTCSPGRIGRARCRRASPGVPRADQ